MQGINWYYKHFNDTKYKITSGQMARLAIMQQNFVAQHSEIPEILISIFMYYFNILLAHLYNIALFSTHMYSTLASWDLSHGFICTGGYTHIQWPISGRSHTCMYTLNDFQPKLQK